MLSHTEPPVQAAVRAMDTIVEFTAEVDGTEISKFMVSGASKVSIYISVSLYV